MPQPRPVQERERQEGECLDLWLKGWSVRQIRRETGVGQGRLADLIRGWRRELEEGAYDGTLARNAAAGYTHLPEKGSGKPGRRPKPITAEEQAAISEVESGKLGFRAAGRKHGVPRDRVRYLVGKVR